MDAAKTVTATFVKVWVLTVSVTGNGTVFSEQPGIDCGTDCTETYDQGTTVSLNATPGASFIGWGGDCLGILSTTCTFTMNGTKNVTATFAP
jgi:hypothetical protein